MLEVYEPRSLLTYQVHEKWHNILYIALCIAMEFEPTLKFEM